MAENQRSKVTLRDIATETGYSVNAVSRALRGLNDIGPAASQRIREAADRLGYVGNLSARALRSGRTWSISLLVPSMTNPYFSVMTDLIQVQARHRGYSLSVMCIRDDPVMAMQCAEQAIARCADGVLLFPIHGCEAVLQRLFDAGMPCVQLSASVSDTLSDSVVIDDEEGGRLAALALADAGCRKVCFMSASGLTVSVDPRRNGFLRGCRQAGYAPEAVVCRDYDEWYFTVTEEQRWRGLMTEELLRLRSTGVDGLFAFCDMEAYRVLNLLEDSDELSPKDFCVVGFDNMSAYLNLMKSVCTVDGGQEEIAEVGMECLLRRIEGDDRPPVHHPCAVRLIPGKTAAPVTHRNR